MKYKILTKTNPFDEWKVCKTFKDLKRAKQSLETLRKNVSEPYRQNPLYFQYKLIEK